MPSKKELLLYFVKMMIITTLVVFFYSIISKENECLYWVSWATMCYHDNMFEYSDVSWKWFYIKALDNWDPILVKK